MVYRSSQALSNGVSLPSREKGAKPYAKSTISAPFSLEGRLTPFETEPKGAKEFTEQNAFLYGDQWWLENPVNKGGDPREAHPTPRPLTGRTFESKGQGSGLIQVYSHQGGPSTLFALECLHKKQAPLFNLKIKLNLKIDPAPLSTAYYAFISDEGFLYAPALQKWDGFLPRFVFIKTKTSLQSLSAALETIQTGLFTWIGLRPSLAPNAVQLRKLQLACEKNQAELYLFPPAPLPHWLFQLSVEVSYDKNGKPLAYPVSAKRADARAFGRELVGAYA